MGYKVLVVEDDAFLISAYKVKLAQEGFEVQFASDGEEAMKILESFMPDVILMDAVMPRKDGFATLAEIKAQDKLKNIPVIMASNLGQIGDVEKAKSLGAVDFVTKSNMSIGDLSNKIKSVAGGK
jgi:CheY-like chemotaxis protein